MKEVSTNEFSEEELEVPFGEALRLSDMDPADLSELQSAQLERWDQEAKRIGKIIQEAAPKILDGVKLPPLRITPPSPPRPAGGGAKLAGTGPERPLAPHLRASDSSMFFPHLISAADAIEAKKEENRVLMRENAKSRQTTWISAIVGAVIGAAVALLPQLFPLG